MKETTFSSYSPSKKNNPLGLQPSAFFFSFFISKLSHDDSIDIFLPLWAQQKNHGTMWSTCLPNDEGGRGETPPPRPFLPQTLIKSTNRSIVVAQSALLSCQWKRRGHRDEWHTGWSHHLDNHVGTLHQDSIISLNLLRLDKRGMDSDQLKRPLDFKTS